MGGRALLGKCETRRISTEEYLALVQEIKELLKDYYEVFNYAKFVGDKEDHGDIDMFVTYAKQEHNPETIAKVLNSKAYVRNGPSTSFEYKGVQVDISYSAPNMYNFSYVSHCYGDLGRMMGVVACKLGLRYTNTGLWIDLYRNQEGLPNVSEFQNMGGYFGEVLLTGVPQKAFNILGFDYERWCQKFATNLEVYEFVYSSKYFASSMFRPVKKEKKVRSMYQGFMDWVLEQPVKTERLDPSQFRVNAVLASHKVTEVATVVNHEYEKIRIKQVFNTDMVIQVSGYEGRDLGDFLKWLNHRQDLQDLIIIGDKSMVMDKIKELLNVYEKH